MKKPMNLEQWGRSRARGRYGAPKGDGFGADAAASAKINFQEPQDPNNKHGAKYDNIVGIDTWLRNENAATKPSFDKANAWRGAKLREK